MMSRYGFAEETYFTFCYSPVFEPGGASSASSTVVTETTSQVLATRRLGVLQRLGSLPALEAGSTAEAVRGGPSRAGRRPCDCPSAWSTCCGEAGPRSSPARHRAGRRTATELIAEHVRKAIATGTALRP